MIYYLKLLFVCKSYLVKKKQNGVAKFKNNRLGLIYMFLFFVSRH